MVGYEDTFEISPSIINQEGKFVISVKNNKRIDFEQTRQINFKVMQQKLLLQKVVGSDDHIQMTEVMFLRMTDGR